MKPIRIRPYDPSRPRKPRSEAQEAATQRNFHIMRIRALWALSYILSPARREMVQDIIDAELRAKGAEPQGVRRARERVELFEALERDRDAAIRDLTSDIPF